MRRAPVFCFHRRARHPLNHGGNPLLMSTLSKTVLTCLVACLLVSVPASASPTATAARKCSTRGIEQKLGASPGYVINLSTRRISCADARSLSRLYHRCRRDRGGRDGSCPRVRRFRCTERRFNRNYIHGKLIQYDSNVLCVRGSQRMRQTYEQLVRY